MFRKINILCVVLLAFIVLFVVLDLLGVPVSAHFDCANRAMIEKQKDAVEK